MATLLNSVIVSQTLLLDMKCQRTRREIQKYCNIKTEPSMSSKSAENKWDAGKEREREWFIGCIISK